MVGSGSAWPKRGERGRKKKKGGRKSKQGKRRKKETKREKKIEKGEKGKKKRERWRCRSGGEVVCCARVAEEITSGGVLIRTWRNSDGRSSSGPRAKGGDEGEEEEACAR